MLTINIFSDVAIARNNRYIKDFLICYVFGVPRWIQYVQKTGTIKEYEFEDLVEFTSETNTASNLRRYKFVFNYVNFEKILHSKIKSQAETLKKVI